MRLTKINSVSEEDAEYLASNGITYLEDLAGTKPIRIEKLGFDPEIVAEALFEINHGDLLIDSDRIDYTCQYCSETFAGIQSHSHDKHVKSGCKERPGVSANPFGGKQ
jgi:hypothetical protein